jgi:hypothetical protein
MSKDKYYFFRELENEGNLLNGLSFHSAGLVEKTYSENSVSSKDLSVVYFHPFLGEVVSTWLSTDEVELFEVSQYEYEQLKTVLNGI